MTPIYRIHDGHALAMEEVRCRNEEKELQDLLEKSPELLAGEQISPDNPRKWLQLKREMDVPDPVTGSARWSIDFLFVDQDAVLTFVECKRHDDTRARREVIAQVLDYAANAPRLWRADDIEQAARITQQRRGQSLEEAIRSLTGSGDDPAAFFSRAIENLNQHKLRIVLFLESAPPELKTVVEFLVNELSRVEIVLVEAKRFRSGGIEVVSPSVWGYTEKVRHHRQVLEEALSGGRRSWDQDTFFAELSQRIHDDAAQEAVGLLFRELPNFGYRITWGTGANGSMSLRLPGVTDRAIATVTTDGDLLVNYGSLSRTEAETTFRDGLAVALVGQLGIAKPPNFPNCYPRIKNADWANRSEMLLEIFRNLSGTSRVAGETVA